MITISNEYYRNLDKIQRDHNLPSLAVLLPSTENIYEINLNTREIQAPEFLSNYTDHAAEVLYFKCDRFFDYMDLSTCTIVIQYTNAKGESRLYSVPFVDVATCSLENKMLIPWCVDGNVTTQAGEVTFSIRFYKIDVNGAAIQYSLTTLSAKSQVLEAMNVIEEDEEPFVLNPTQYEELVARIQAYENMNDLTWIVLD